MRARGVTPRGGAALVALVAYLAAGAGCGDTKTAPIQPYHPTAPSYTPEELRASLDYLKFYGITFDVSVALYRDFMPQSPPEGQPLTAHLTVVATGESRFPDGITSAYVWVLNGDEIWSSWMEPLGDGGVANQRRYFAGGGPLWDPGLLVDVVVGLRTSPTSVHLVLIRDVKILRTD